MRFATLHYATYRARAPTDDGTGRDGRRHHLWRVTNLRSSDSDHGLRGSRSPRPAVLYRYCCRPERRFILYGFIFGIFMLLSLAPRYRCQFVLSSACLAWTDNCLCHHRLYWTPDAFLAVPVNAQPSRSPFATSLSFAPSMPRFSSCWAACIAHG